MDKILGVNSESFFEWSESSEELKNWNLNTLIEIYDKRHKIVHHDLLPVTDINELRTIFAFFTILVVHSTVRFTNKFKIQDTLSNQIKPISTVQYISNLRSEYESIAKKTYHEVGMIVLKYEEEGNITQEERNRLKALRDFDKQLLTPFIDVFSSYLESLIGESETSQDIQKLGSKVLSMHGQIVVNAVKLGLKEFQ